MSTLTSRVILPMLLGAGAFLLLLNVIYIRKNASKRCLITVGQQSDLDFKTEVRSLKARDHPSKTSLKDTETPLKDAETPLKDAETPLKDAETPLKDAETPLKDTETPLKAVEAPAEKASRDLPVCPDQPPELVGSVSVNVTRLVELDDVVKNNTELKLGGFYSPPHCQPRNNAKVAIVIPFRDREVHLNIFLRYMIPILRRQLLQFKVYVIEQAGNCSFNRGVLRNIGAVEAAKASDWQCFVFHDVDLILENDRNLYTCPESPKHLSVAIDTLNYTLMYKQLFGGVIILTKEQFWKVNGYSNLYFGWGAEDDDLYKRVFQSGMKVIRPEKSVARYKMIRGHHHTSDKANPANSDLLKHGLQRRKTDGINSLSYEIVSERPHPLYTRITVALKDHVKC